MKRIRIVVSILLSGLLSCVYDPTYQGSKCGPGNSCPPGYLCLNNGAESYCSATAAEEPVAADGDSGVSEEENGGENDIIITDGDDGEEEDGDITIADGDETPDGGTDGDETTSDGDEAISDEDETPNDCSLPNPESPLFLFFCLEENKANLTLWRLFSVNEQWAPELGCTSSNFSSGSRLTCPLTDYGSGTSMSFDIAVDNRWACTLGTGILKVWYQGSELFAVSSEPQIANENGLTNGYYIAGDHWLFQTFTTGSTASEIKNISMHIVDKVGSPRELIISIRATDNGLPNGPDLISVTISEVFINRGWNTWDITEFLNLAPQTQYALIVRAPSGSYPNHFYSWDRSNTSAYSGGRAGEMDGTGNANFLGPSIDYLFRVKEGCDFKIAIP